MGLFVVLFPLWVGVIVVTMLHGDTDAGASFVFVVWLAFAAWVLWNALRRGVLSITIDDRVLILRFPVGKARIRVEDLRSVETSWWDINRFAPFLRSREGKFRLLGPFDAMYELLGRLKELNPAIEIKRL